MAVLFLGVRMLDGFEQTRENVAGKLPKVFADAGLIWVEEAGGLRTVFGRLAFYRAETRA